MSCLVVVWGVIMFYFMLLLFMWLLLVLVGMVLVVLVICLISSDKFGLVMCWWGVFVID